MGLCSSSTATEDHFNEKDQTRFLFSKEINPSLSFAEQLREAIAARTDNIQQIKRRVLSQLQSRRSMRNRWLKICDESIDRGVTLAMVGRVNVGKSTLVSALLGCNFTRPSSADEVTRGKPIRFVYSDKPVLRRIELRERGGCVWEESILSEKSIAVDDWELFVAEDEFVDSLIMITEIGSPSPILKCGLTIVDCPAACLESSSISMLQHMNVTVLCFVYDHGQGFALNDGQLLKNLLKGFSQHSRSTLPEIILIGNKYDDTLQKRMFADDDGDTNLTVRRNCPWKHAMSSPFIDKDRILPVQLFPTVSAVDLQSQFDAGQSVSSMMKRLQCSIIRKIIDSSRAILYKLESIFIFNKFNTDLYFLIKSLLIEEDLIELIHHECCFNDENLLLDFTRGYKVFGVKYRGDDIHVTSITGISSRGNDVIDKQYRQERRDLAARNQPHSIIYESTDGKQSHIYLIEKERGPKRLLDHLQDYSQKQLVEFLQLIDGERIYMNPNFRPDNIFVDRSDSICVNLSIPNHPHLPFLHKDKLQTEPFHLHPRHKHLSKLGRNCCRSSSGQREYCLARTIWILLDGRAMNGVNDANSEDSQMTQDGIRWSYLSEEMRRDEFRTHRQNLGSNTK